MNADPELGAFLRRRRESTKPAEVGLVDAGRRRTPGLRREEVAMLAGVSVSWYTWLEQGRPIKASIDVLDALARVFALDETERDHLIALAGHRLHHTGSPTGVDVPEWAERLLDSLDPIPAYLLGPTWEYLGWNRAQAELFPAMTALPDEERNLVWVMFAVAEVRSLIADWELEAHSMLTQFRADITPWRDDPAVVDLVDRLRRVSAEFDRWWEGHDVSGFQTRLRRFNHPTRGPLLFEYQQLIPAGRTDLRVVMQLPVQAPTDTPAAAVEPSTDPRTNP
ncbi:MAG: helix-turn-helix domain-containing protein [Actinobacteria bacterium]|nr:helix-turn-helix domain-containing protein [Actinomycetota bacterium]